MKTIKISILLLFALHSIILSAQDNRYSLTLKGNATDNKISISNMSADLHIMAHSANEIIITTDEVKPLPEKAKGLRPLSISGPDNTNIGLHVKYENGIIAISGAGKTANEGDYKILVPSNINIHVEYESFNAGDISVDDLNGEIEIKANSSDLILKNITGPVVLHTLNTDIDLTFSKVGQSKPSSVSSVNGDIEIKMPANTPADFKFSTINGEIYTDMDLKMKENEGTLTRIGGGMNGKATNAGGGVQINLNTVNGNVYLRKN